VFAHVLGTVIGRLRQQRAMTQIALAARVGTSQALISRIESGKAQPDVLTYGKIAAAFGMSLQDLDRRVNEAVAATKRAAEAFSGRGKSSDDLLAVAGTVALAGLIAFAVAAIFDETK
jgi:transcriptional regulator with XRE-family HTH domain